MQRYLLILNFYISNMTYNDNFVYWILMMMMMMMMMTKTTMMMKVNIIIIISPVSSFSLEDVSGLWDCGPASPGAGLWPWLWPWNGGGVSLSMPPVNTKPVCCLCVGMSWVGPVSTVDGCSSAVFQSDLDDQVLMCWCCVPVSWRFDVMEWRTVYRHRNVLAVRRTTCIVTILVTKYGNQPNARRIVSPYMSTNHRCSR